MEVTTAVATRPGLSVTAKARRAQIVAATVEVIADAGYGQASFARIAKRAGLSSTRLISYHFAGKDELIAAVAESVISTMGRFMATRVESQSGAAAKLRAYVEGNVEFICSHRAPMKALLEIFLGGGLHYDAAVDRSVVSPVEAILRQGQDDGVFRDFDPAVMATVVQRAIEGLPFLLESVPDLDCGLYARELVTLFELGTLRRRR
jgi:AcrR family transcriptional regulator